MSKTVFQSLYYIEINIANPQRALFAEDIPDQFTQFPN